MYVFTFGEHLMFWSSKLEGLIIMSSLFLQMRSAAIDDSVISSSLPAIVSDITINVDDMDESNCNNVSRLVGSHVSLRLKTAV